MGRIIPPSRELIHIRTMRVLTTEAFSVLVSHWRPYWLKVRNTEANLKERHEKGVKSAQISSLQGLSEREAIPGLLQEQGMVWAPLALVGAEVGDALLKAQSLSLSISAQAIVDRAIISSQKQRIRKEKSVDQVPDLNPGLGNGRIGWVTTRRIVDCRKLSMPRTRFSSIVLEVWRNLGRSLSQQLWKNLYSKSEPWSVAD